MIRYLAVPCVIALALTYIHDPEPTLRDEPVDALAPEGETAYLTRCPPDEQESSIDLTERLAARDRFAIYCQGIVNDLMARRINLVAARERVYFFCLAYYPEHLHNLVQTATEGSLRELVARNLLNDLQMNQHFVGWTEKERFELLSHYECELYDSLQKDGVEAQRYEVEL